MMLEGFHYEPAPTMPAELRDVFDPLARKWEHVIPTWCHAVWVIWDAQGKKETSLSCSVRPQYRSATIRISPSWLDGNASEREGDVLHELLHIALGPMVEIVDMVCADEENKTIAKNLERLWRNAYEGAVTDLTASILTMSIAEASHDLT